MQVQAEDTAPLGPRSTPAKRLLIAGLAVSKAAGVRFELTEGVNPQQFSRLPRLTAPAPRLRHRLAPAVAENPYDKA
jgi:hypothetical protein